MSPDPQEPEGSGRQGVVPLGSHRQDTAPGSSRLDRAQASAAQVLRRVRGPSRHTVEDLVSRVEQLEADVAEAGRLNVRLAELTDVVQELLVPLAQRDEQRIREVLDRYTAELGS